MTTKQSLSKLRRYSEAVTLAADTMQLLLNNGDKAKRVVLSNKEKVVEDRITSISYFSEDGETVINVVKFGINA